MGHNLDYSCANIYIKSSKKGIEWFRREREVDASGHNLRFQHKKFGVL